MATRAITRATASTAALALAAAPASACPRCAVGQAARREVWRDDFFPHLAVALLPFIIIGAICARLHALGRP